MTQDNTEMVEPVDTPIENTTSDDVTQPEDVENTVETPLNEVSQSEPIFEPLEIEETNSNLPKPEEKPVDPEEKPVEKIEIKPVENTDEQTETPRIEKDRLESENTNLQAQAEKIEKKRAEVQALVLRNEQLLKSIESVNLDNADKLLKIEEATRSARSESDAHNEELRALRTKWQEIINNSSRMDSLATQAKLLITIFRNEVIKFVQLHGPDVNIPELTQEHKEIVAKTIAPHLFNEEIYK